MNTRLPDLVEFGQFSGRVVAEVTDQLPHVGLVLLRHVSTVIAVVGARPSEGDLIRRAVVEQVVVDELASVIRAVPISA